MLGLSSSAGSAEQTPKTKNTRQTNLDRFIFAFFLVNRLGEIIERRHFKRFPIWNIVADYAIYRSGFRSSIFGLPTLDNFEL